MVGQNRNEYKWHLQIPQVLYHELFFSVHKGLTASITDSIEAFYCQQLQGKSSLIFMFWIDKVSKMWPEQQQKLNFKNENYIHDKKVQTARHYDGSQYLCSGIRQSP